MNQYQNTPELTIAIPYRRVWQMNSSAKNNMTLHPFYQDSPPSISVSARVPSWKSSITKRMIGFSFLAMALLLSVAKSFAQSTGGIKAPVISGRALPDSPNGLEVSLVTPFPILVRGRVVDHFGNGVKGAQVHVMVKGAKVSAVTDADGNYTLELEGGYKYGSIQIAADNFRTTEKEINLQDFSAIGTLVPVVTKMELLEDDLIKAIRPGMKVNGTVK
jgi:phosphatidate phosphatase APP1